jgi:hypothetical protein
VSTRSTTYVGTRAKALLFPRLIRTYDWVADNGRANLSSWIEAAAKKAGR